MTVEFDLRKTSTLPLLRQFPYLYRYAAANAVNDVAFDAKARLKFHAKRAFRNPKPFTYNAALVYSKAKIDNLQAKVGLKDRGEVPKAGTSPDIYLRRQIIGGERNHKRFEKALLRRFPQFGRGTFFMPATQNRSFLDNYGQLRGGVVTQMLSQLQAFPEQGYRANIRTQIRPFISQYSTKGITGCFPLGFTKETPWGARTLKRSSSLFVMLHGTGKDTTIMKR